MRQPVRRRVAGGHMDEAGACLLLDVGRAPPGHLARVRQYPSRPRSMPKTGPAYGRAYTPTIPRERRAVVDAIAAAHAALGDVDLGPACTLALLRSTVQGHRPRLYWCGAETRANLCGGQGDAPAATVVERARSCRARWASGRDGGGSGGRTVY